MSLMPIKKFLIITYGVAGLFIASVTALFTFLIIEEPIGYKMGSKIALTVVSMSPIVILMSVVIGTMFSKQIRAIASRLHEIADGEYGQRQLHTDIQEFHDINDASNTLSASISSLMHSLQKRNEELKMMLLTFSHDIKTPVMISNGYLEELEDGMIPPAQLQAVYAKLKAENDFINELCEEIIFYQNSKEQLRSYDAPVNVSAIAEEVIVLLNASVENGVEPGLAVAFNPIDLKKVLMNLFQNAVKYAGSDTIRIYNRNRDIIVEDTGIGIAHHEAEKIFEPFYTLESSKNRSASGFGLGLAIVKNLCSRNRCEIMLDTGYHPGTRFVLSPA